jgi:hypothetical protein
MHESVSVSSTMVKSISIKLLRVSQQKRTSIHKHNIKISNNMIRANGKMYPGSLCYLDLTTVVEPLNIVWMWVFSQSQAMLLDYLTVYQVVAATAIDDGENTIIVNDEEDVKQVVVLNLVCTINLYTQRSLHNDGSILVRVMSTKDLLLTRLMILVVSCNFNCSNIIILNIRNTNIPTISSSDVGTFAWTFPLHVAKSLTVVALDVKGM